MNEKILATVKQLREKSEKRNFPQTFDLIINLQGIDLKKPESKINEEFPLPHGKGRESKVAIFSDTLKLDGVEILGGSDLDGMSKNKRIAKKLVQNTDFFLADVKMMPVVAKVLGQFIGPKGKLPKIISGDASSLVKNLKRAVRARIKDSPVIQCPVGNENMKDEEIAENIQELLKFLEGKLPKGRNNIGNIMLKLTMNKPVELKV